MIPAYCVGTAEPELSPDERDYLVAYLSDWLRHGNDIYCAVCSQSVRDVVLTDDSQFVCRPCYGEDGERGA